MAAQVKLKPGQQQQKHTFVSSRSKQQSRLLKITTAAAIHSITQRLRRLKDSELVRFEATSLSIKNLGKIRAKKRQRKNN